MTTSHHYILSTTMIVCGAGIVAILTVSITDALARTSLARRVFPPPPPPAPHGVTWRLGMPRPGELLPGSATQLRAKTRLRAPLEADDPDTTQILRVPAAAPRRDRSWDGTWAGGWASADDKLPGWRPDRALQNTQPVPRVAEHVR